MKYLVLITLILFQGGNNPVIKNPWLRPAPEAFNTAFYCTIMNNSDNPDTLYKAVSDISDNLQIHETYKRGDMTGMRQVNEIAIAPHDSLVLKPGSFHIMVMNLKENAQADQMKQITLFFRQSGKMIVKAEVRK
jgi:copper(I)-binding protein